MNFAPVTLNTAPLMLPPRRAIQGPEITQQPMGQEESEFATGKESDSSLAPYQNQQGGLSPLSGEKTLRGSPPSDPGVFRGASCLSLLQQDIA